MDSIDHSFVLNKAGVVHTPTDELFEFQYPDDLHSIHNESLKDFQIECVEFSFNQLEMNLSFEISGDQLELLIEAIDLDKNWLGVNGSTRIAYNDRKLIFNNNVTGGNSYSSVKFEIPINRIDIGSINWIKDIIRKIKHDTDFIDKSIHS